jgi:phage terminase large subunit-like protein
LRVIVIQKAGVDYPEELLGNKEFMAARETAIRKRLQLRDEDAVQAIEDTSEDGVWTVIGSDDIEEILNWFIEFNAIGSIQDIEVLGDDDREKLGRLLEALGMGIKDLIDVYGLEDEEEEERMRKEEDDT